MKTLKESLQRRKRLTPHQKQMGRSRLIAPMRWMPVPILVLTFTLLLPVFIVIHTIVGIKNGIVDGFRDYYYAIVQSLHC